MKIKVSIVIASCFFLLQSCVNFKFDYRPPVSGPTAKVLVRSKVEGYNLQIISHGAQPCDANSASLVGLLNAAAAGQKKVQELNIVVVANNPVAFSMPQQSLANITSNSMTFGYCQPIVRFTPKENSSYIVEFESCSANVYEINIKENILIAKSTSEKLCNTSTVNMGKPEKIFYLTKPNP